ncbi:MAG: hypothetical protein QXJ19_00560 [Candidatus Bathyarchaeia archaeon]
MKNSVSNLLDNKSTYVYTVASADRNFIHNNLMKKTTNTHFIL